MRNCDCFCLSRCLNARNAGCVAGSIINRLKKLPVRDELPAYLCGGVVAHHPYLAELMKAEMGIDIRPTIEPQYMVALGAALIAKRHHASNK